MSLDAFLRAFDTLPDGGFTGCSNGKRYNVVKRVSGACQSLLAEEMGGRDYISYNLYRLTSGARLKPCEMSRAKVIDFTLSLEVENSPLSQ
ncbi:MAG: hypothetical protein AAF686_02845 [Pseudomonadota bacterium]